MIPPPGAIAAGILCVAILGVALWHGGAMAGAHLLAQGVGLAAFCLTVLGSSKGTWRRGVRGPLAVLIGLAALALVQSIELPSGLIEALAPERARLARDTASAIGTEAPPSVALSLAPAISRQVAFELAALAAVLVAASRAFSVRRRRRFVVASALAAGLVQIVVGAEPLLARRVPRLVGSYANPDHLAMFLGMGAAVCLATIIWIAQSGRWSDNMERRVLGMAGFSAILLVFVVGVALTGSRAALAALGTAFAVQIVLLSRKSGHRRALVVVLILALLIVGFLGWIGAERAYGRLLGTTWHDAVASGRLTVWREATPLIAVSPWVGVGLGGFQESYALVQKTGSARVTWARAHNDYLELMICGGLLGVAVFLLGAFWTIRDLARVFAGASRSEDRVFVLGVLGALTAVAVHELLDFGLALSANSMLLAVLVGAALATGSAQRESGLAQIELEGRNGSPAS